VAGFERPMTLRRSRLAYQSFENALPQSFFIQEDLRMLVTKAAKLPDPKARRSQKF
jgi:hypothetical protein